MNTRKQPEKPAGNATAGSLYQSESRVYPKSVRGKFAHLRQLAMWVLLGLFYGVVWLTWDQRQAVLFDLPARKFYIWGLTLWPQDFFYLALLLLLLALCLFFFTALAGRLWCGYACPQTVWTEAFLLIERWIEGDRNARMKLDRGPRTGQYWRKKALKQFLWIALALWTGLTFVGYFMPVRELVDGIMHLQLHPWAWFWLLFYGLATYGNAGFLREQVCKYMCPYARFQGAMFDRDTLIIAYDPARGEPRGSRSRSADRTESGLGDCIDCTLCVQVCPTGIDIREGLQIECIACAACIDVCDQVMEKMDYPKGLIRYSSSNRMAGKATRWMRPRMAVYAALLVAITAGLVLSVSTRTPLRMDVIRDRNSLYRELPGGLVENVYTLRIINMTEADQTYRLSLSDQPTLTLDNPPLQVPAGTASAFPLRIKSELDDGNQPMGGISVSLNLQSTTQPQVEVTRTTRFFRPVR